MEHLWAPWRMAYIEANPDEQGCIFCNRLAQDEDDQNLILQRAARSFLILNRYPYTSGHLMAVPAAHVASLEMLSPADQAELMEMTTRAISALRSVYDPDGFNVGVNIGEAAGAGIEDHVHVHIVPRWDGDTNFMASTAQTRVLPESLEDTYQRLKHTLNANWHPPDRPDGGGSSG